MDFKIIDPNDFPFYCGTCLRKFSEIKHDVHEMPTEMLQFFEQLIEYEISEESLYPDGICEQCYNTLNDAYNFQIMSKKSKKFLDEIIVAFSTKPAINCVEDEFINKTDEIIVDSPLSPGLKDTTLDDPLESESEQIIVKIEADVLNEDKSSLININGAQILNVSTSEITCNICNKNFSSPSALTLHMDCHSTGHPFKCDQCDRGFNARLSLKRHKEIHLKEPLKIICKYGCGKIFNRSHQAYSHYQRKHPNHENLTNVTSKTGRKHHQSIDVNNTTDKNSNDEDNEQEKEDESSLLNSVNSIINRTCTVCKKIYASISGLTLHMNSHQEKRPFQCDQCEQGFNAKISLKRHMELHLKKPLQIVCKYGCGKIFNRSQQANKHYQTKHRKNTNITNNDTSNETTNINDDPTYICEDCGKVCKNLRSFKQHRNRHLPYEERPYPCKQCNKRFGARTDLLFHMRRHDGIKKFECSYCGVKTVTGRELRLHVSNVHTKEMQVSCDVCSKVFLHLGSLRRHEKVVHQGIKNYKCKYCVQSFAKAETLKNHEMRHTGERPHKCKYCDKSFIQSFMRNTHMKKHHSEFFTID